MRRGKVTQRATRTSNGRGPRHRVHRATVWHLERDPIGPVAEREPLPVRVRRDAAVRIRVAVAREHDESIWRQQEPSLNRDPAIVFRGDSPTAKVDRVRLEAPELDPLAAVGMLRRFRGRERRALGAVLRAPRPVLDPGPPRDPHAARVPALPELRAGASGTRPQRAAPQRAARRVIEVRAARSAEPVHRLRRTRSEAQPSVERVA